MVLLDTETPRASREIYSEDAEGEAQRRNLWITNPLLDPVSYTSHKLLLGKSCVYPVGVLHHYVFIISQLLLPSHPRSKVVLLDTETPGATREIYSEYAEGDAQTHNPWIANPVLYPLSYTAQKLFLGSS